jgi:pimeloyl-ACP methyl ester carboxylesterase
MQDYAEDAIAFLDGIGWHEKVSVVGESFGGMTALHLAVLAPERINRMVIASATAGGAFASYDISSFLELPRRDAAMQSLYLQDTRNRDLHRCDPEAFERLLTDRLEFATTFADPSVSSGGYVRLLQARRQHDCISQLDKITMPVTVIAGKFDRQAPVESQQALVTALPDATIHTFDQGHGVLFNSPAATQAAISALV